jgi:2-hydroxy-6-oxonona-2,4-dienedioate hydrolase
MKKRHSEEGGTEIDGRRVRFITAPPDAAGEGAPLREVTLLLHGLGCSSEVWEPTVETMAQRGLTCRVIAPDMPGYGHSPGPPEALGMEDLADWTVRFLDDRRLDRVHIAGNSMGCQVAMALARRHADRVCGLVLQGPTTGERIVPPWRYVAGLLADAFHESPTYNLRLLKMYMQMGPVRYMETVKKMLADDPIGHADAVRAPCLIIRGGHDTIVSDDVARRLVASLPDAVYVPLEAAAHAIEYNEPDKFVDAMITFLQTTERKMQSA